MSSTPAVPAVDLAGERSAIEAAIARACDALLADVRPEVAEAVRYSVRGPGKRLRGMLVVFAYRAAGGRGDASGLAAAVEMIHAYSLVHDDLPCMDDDDVRRGRPTTHRVYGTDTAVLAGVAMIPLAVGCVTTAARSLALTDDVAASLVATLMRAAGAAGMIGGQWRDLQAEGEQPSSAEALETIHRAKTGALIAAAARLGGIAAAAPPTAVDALGRFGEELGLAFQIIDDVLDVTATTEVLGKTAGRDVALAKSTYPALLGVPGAIARARQHVADGCRALDDAGLLTAELRHLADLIITRTN